MNAELRERLMVQLARSEGKRNRMYLDSCNIPTIGIGHNLNHPISDKAVAQIFHDDIDAVEANVERELPWIMALSLPRQAVIYDMAFNLGIGGLLGFRKFLAAAQAEQWDEAEREMKDSDWWGQVGDRAPKLARQWRTGEWQ